jgi:hypothetical protein
MRSIFTQGFLLGGRPPFIRLRRRLNGVISRPPLEPDSGALLGDARGRYGAHRPTSSFSGNRALFVASAQAGACSTRVSSRSIQSTIAQASAQRSGLGAGSRQRSVAARVGCTKSTLSRRKRGLQEGGLPGLYPPDRPKRRVGPEQFLNHCPGPCRERTPSAISPEPLLEPLWVLFLASHASLVGTP